MNILYLNKHRSLFSLTLWGASLGSAAALGYGLLYSLYVILRSSGQIIYVLPIREGLAGSLAANAVSILVAGLVIALIFSIPAFLIAGFITIILRLIHPLINPQRTAVRAINTGGLVAVVIAFALGLIVHQLMTGFPDFYPVAYLTWIGLPCFIMILLSVWISLNINRLEFKHA